MVSKDKAKNTSRKKNEHKVAKAFLGILLIIVICMGIFVGYSTIKNGWGIQGIVQTAMGQDKHTLENLDPLIVLLMGVSKDIDVELTDTLMVASYNPKNQKAVLLSIPRDTFTGKNKNKATAGEKINSLYQKGPEKTLAAVNEITGLNIEKYIVIDNKALIELVDAIGGVEFDVPIDMDYDDVTQDLYIHLSKGLQKLDGEQAEQLVRFRKNNNGTTYPSEYGDNDMGRMRTQREFLKVVAEQTISIKNITKIGEFIDIFKKNVKTNITDWNEIKKYIPYVISFSTENIENVTLPGEPAMFNKLWFFVYNKNETEELINTLFREQEEVVVDENVNDTQSETKSEVNETAKDKIKVEVLNGSSNTKKLTEVTNILKQKGYNVYNTGTTTSTAKTTIINKSKIDDSLINDIKSDLGKGIISSGNAQKNNKVDVTIIIGRDF